MTLWERALPASFIAIRQKLAGGARSHREQSSRAEPCSQAFLWGEQELAGGARSHRAKLAGGARSHRGQELACRARADTQPDRYAANP